MATGGPTPRITVHRLHTVTCNSWSLSRDTDKVETEIGFKYCAIWIRPAHSTTGSSRRSMRRAPARLLQSLLHWQAPVYIYYEYSTFTARIEVRNDIGRQSSGIRWELSFWLTVVVILRNNFLHHIGFSHRLISIINEWSLPADWTLPRVLSYIRVGL